MGVVVVGLAFAGIALFLAFTAVAILFKVVLRLVLLPFLLLKWIVMGTIMLVVGPVLLVIGLATFLVLGLVLSVPLLPLVALGAIVWLLVRASRRPAVA
jgi:hypothetical protein